jgi:hypothetical protein
VLIPDGPEWVTLPDGRVVRALAGGAGGTYVQGYELPVCALTRTASQHSQTTLALDSAYTHASAGDAIARRLHFPVAETLSAVYYFVTAYTGTAANVNDLTLELRNNSTTTGPSTTLHEGMSHDPGATTGWRSSTGWSFAMSADTSYWLVLGDADGGGTDYATVLRNMSGYGLPDEAASASAWQTTDGWASVRTAAAAPSNLVMLFSSGRVSGNPMTSSAATASSQNRRGWRFVAPASIKLLGMVVKAGAAVALTTRTSIELWTGTDGPSGSPTATGTVEVKDYTSLADQAFGYVFGTPPTLTQGTAYRLVFTYGANSTSPSKMSIGTGADATLRSAMLGGGTWYFAGANSTTDWSNDDESAQPLALDLLVEDFVTNSNLIVHPGMSGRLSG